MFGNPREGRGGVREAGSRPVPAVDLYVGVRRGQAVGHVALHAFELGLLGGVVDGAHERVRVLLPLGSMHPHHQADTVPVLHERRGLPEQEGLPTRLDEGGEPVEVPPHCCRALGLLMLLGALAPPGQGGGHRVQGGRSAETLGRIDRRRAVVPVVVPVVITALAGVEAASAAAPAAGPESSLGLGVWGGVGDVGGLGGLGGRRDFDFGRGQAVIVGVGGDVVSEDLHIGGREEASLPPAVLPLQPAIQLLLAEESHQLLLCYGDLPWVFRVEVVQHSGL